MPSPAPSLAAEDVHRFVAEHCFGARGRGQVGIEIELLTYDTVDRRRRPDIDAMQAATARACLPGGSLVSFEPGGQVELSGPPDALAGALAGMAPDLAALRGVLGDAGVTVCGLGADPLRPPRRIVRTPRYEAMETHFDALGPAGRRMMCQTAAVQVNVDLDGPLGPHGRWRLAHQLWPVLAAAFAHSPFEGGRVAPCRSTRLAIWDALEPRRTRPVLTVPEQHREPATAWAEYALRADVMLIVDGEHRTVPVPPGLSFARWLERGHDLGWPTPEDLAYHFTTLFPPVRPRGWLELRMIDGLPDRWWPVAVAVTAALFDDDDAAADAGEATATTAGLWAEAAAGLAHPALAAAAARCFATALAALPRLGVDGSVQAACAAYHDRFVARRRTPADELVDAWAAAAGNGDLAGLVAAGDQAAVEA